MEIIKLNFEVKKAFGNLHRKRTVLVAAEDGAGNILIGSKPDFYPPEISRLLGGGVDENEGFAQAAIRELREELNVLVEKSQLKPLSTFKINATASSGEKFVHETRVYYVNINDSPYSAGDDVKDILQITIDQLHELGVKYEQIPKALWCRGHEGPYNWADYGKMYGPIHKQVAKQIRTMRNKTNLQKGRA